MSFEIITQDEFNNHTKIVDSASFIQKVPMAHLLEKRGFTIKYVAWKENGETLVSSVVFSKPMAGGLYMELKSGPIYTDESKLKDFYNGLKDYAKQQGVIELIVKPYNTYQEFNSDGEPIGEENKHFVRELVELGYTHDGLTTGYPDGEPDWHYVKDMKGITEETLVNSFGKKGKQLLKKAKSFGIKVRKLERDELQIFKDITASTSNRRDYSDKPLEYYEDFYDSFGEDAEFMIATINFEEYLLNLQSNKKIIVDKLEKLIEENPGEKKSAKFNRLSKELNREIETYDNRIEEAEGFISKYGKEEVVLSGSLFIYSGQESTYLFSGSYTEFNKFYSPTLLQEYVMLESIKRGIPLYNFLGIQGIFDGTDGVLRFKQNFNGYVVRKMGTFRYYPNPLKFKLIKLVKRILRR